ncbi:hypothetical protein U1Q18_049010 [Sarracenia purpurea var. burkii]
MISVEALCEHALTVSAAPDYCSEQIRSFFRDSRGSSARLIGQKREDIGGRLPTSLLEGRSAISGFVFVPQPWGMLPAKLFSQICSTSGSGKSPTNSGSESRSLFRNRLSSIKFGVEPLLANGCRGSPSGGRDQCSSRLDSASGGHPGARRRILTKRARSTRSVEAPALGMMALLSLSALSQRASGPGFTPAVLRSVTTGTRSGMTNFPGLISPVVPLRFDYLSGWAPTARSKVCARQSGDADGLRILRVVLCCVFTLPTEVWSF